MSLIEDFTAEIQKNLDEDLDMAEEFFSNNGYPDQPKELKRYIKDCVHDNLPGESIVLRKFLKATLDVDAIFKAIKRPKGLKA